MAARACGNTQRRQQIRGEGCRERAQGSRSWGEPLGRAALWRRGREQGLQEGTAGPADSSR
eukprot:4732712-Prymnesium_polylepis.1